MKQFSTYLLAFTLLLIMALSSCQKDESTIKPLLKTDSLNTLTTRQPGNYLATRGTLKITVEDSTYIFDATRDSIAFVNITIQGQEYYGITAINKAHTLSFGISSFGTAVQGLAGGVAGSQLLVLKPMRPNLQYTLSPNVSSKDIGKISIEQYKQDTLLARGTFKTFLARDTKSTSPFYKVEGTFDLRGH